RIAQSPASAAGRDEARARLDEVREDLTGAVLDDGALGHGKDEIAAVGPVLEVTLADPAVVRAAVRGPVVREASRGLRVDLEDHVAAVAAVRAVGAAQRLELLTPDGDAPVSAVAARDVQSDAIDELSGHGSSQRWKGRPTASCGGRVRAPTILRGCCGAKRLSGASHV